MGGFVPCLYSFPNLFTQQALNPQPTHPAGVCSVIQDGERTRATPWAGAEKSGSPTTTKEGLLLPFSFAATKHNPLQGLARAEERWVWFAWGQQWKNDRKTGQIMEPSRKGQSHSPGRIGMSTRPEGKKAWGHSLLAVWLQQAPYLFRASCFYTCNMIILITPTSKHCQEDYKKYIFKSHCVSTRKPLKKKSILIIWTLTKHWTGKTSRMGTSLARNPTTRPFTGFSTYSEHQRLLVLLTVALLWYLTATRELQMLL